MRERVIARLALACGAALVVACSGSAQTGDARTDAETGAPSDAETGAPSDEQAGIVSASGGVADAAFDLVQTEVRREGDRLVFEERVSGRAGASIPTPSGQLAGARVLSYVWPTSLDPDAVGFEAGTGVLALAATAHPDFDDTPLYDEDGDGANDNDGRLWHSHWVVLTPDDACGPGMLKVRNIPEGESPRLPETWPGLPLFIDSPGYTPELSGAEIRVSVPLEAVGFPTTFDYDGVTAALRVNASVHDPLLCVTDVFDVASGDLSLPGKVQ